MRQIKRVLCALTLAWALPLVGAGGCGGTTGGVMPGDGGGGDGSLALFAVCTDNSDCMSGLCTQLSYDRSATPICTYQCDASDQNPLCPEGCNPKGYCKQPK